MGKTYSGYTNKTAENLLLDAGAFFKNFEVATDTFDSAVTGNKLLGATTGGGTFSAVPTIRRIEVDGVKGAAVGLEVIDEWVVTITANMKELKKEVLALALASGSIDETDIKYSEISASGVIALTDYVDNITWVGRLSGNDEPVIIQVYNAIATGGLTLQSADKAEAVLVLTFTGHYKDTDLDTPPFKIYYPKPAL